MEQASDMDILIMKYVLKVILPDHYTMDQRQLIRQTLASINIHTLRQLLEMPTTELQACKQLEPLRGKVYFCLLHLRGWMKAYINQNAMKGEPIGLPRTLNAWKKILPERPKPKKPMIVTTRPPVPAPVPPTAPQPKPIISKQPAPDPPGYHINDSKAHVPTLMDDHMPTTPARTVDPGEDKPNLPGIWKQHVPEEVPTPAPTTLAPTQSTKARSTPSPTTVMSHPTWEYWCHSSTPFRGAYPSYDDDYCNSISLPTMAAPTPAFTSDICIIGDPPYQLRGG